MDIPIEKKDTDSALDALSCAASVIVWIIIGILIGFLIGTAVVGVVLIFTIFIWGAFGGDYSAAIYYSFIGLIIGIVITTLIIHSGRKKSDT